MLSREKISGYILAGGKSSRMGTDKGLLILNGKPIIVLILEQLKSVVDSICIVSNNPAYQQFNIEVAGDLVKDVGPAGGIYTALCHSKTEKNFIISCDMPFVTNSSISSLIEKSEGYQITVPVFRGMLEPMMGVYYLSCKTKWKELIETETYKLQLLFSHFNTQLLNVDDNPQFNSRIFTNINTASDLSNALNLRQNGN